MLESNKSSSNPVRSSTGYTGGKGCKAKFRGGVAHRTEDYDYEDDDDYYLDDYDEEEPQSLDWEWETYKKSTHVFLPPPIDATTTSV